MSRFMIVFSLLLAGCGAGNALVVRETPAANPPAGFSNQPLSARQAARLEDRQCVRQIGTRIRNAKGHCVAANGRTFTQEDLLRTGEPEWGRALQKLDPSITVRGH